MQTDEEVGKVAQAVPVIIYILFIKYIQTVSIVLFSLTRHTSHFRVVRGVLTNEIDADHAVEERKNFNSVPYEAVHIV